MNDDIAIWSMYSEESQTGAPPPPPLPNLLNDELTIHIETQADYLARTIDGMGHNGRVEAISGLITKILEDVYTRS